MAEEDRRKDPTLLVNVFAKEHAMVWGQREKTTLAALGASLTAESMAKIRCSYILITRGAGRKTLKNIRAACRELGIRMACQIGLPDDFGGCCSGTPSAADWAAHRAITDAVKAAKTASIPPPKPTMTKAEARRRVASGAGVILANGDFDNEWLSEGRSAADAALMREAFDDLMSELRKRCEPPKMRVRKR